MCFEWSEGKAHPGISWCIPGAQSPEIQDPEGDDREARVLQDTIPTSAENALPDFQDGRQMLFLLSVILLHAQTAM